MTKALKKQREKIAKADLPAAVKRDLQLALTKGAGRHNKWDLAAQSRLLDKVEEIERERGKGREDAVRILQKRGAYPDEKSLNRRMREAYANSDLMEYRSLRKQYRAGEITEKEYSQHIAPIARADMARQLDQINQQAEALKRACTGYQKYKAQMQADFEREVAPRRRRIAKLERELAAIEHEISKGPRH